MKKMGFAAIAAAVLVVGLAGCGGPSSDDYWQDAAKDACQKSVASKIIDNSPSFKNVKVEPDGDDRFKVTGSFISSEFTVTKRAFTCDAWMDGSQVAARAIIGKVEETYS